ncbi:MAG: M20/M25/M40 family metallo-hydrolase [Verrucomicrobiota bacterium]
MDKAAKQFLFDLLRQPSPTGWEEPGQAIWMKRMRTFTNQVEQDAYGNAWATFPCERDGAPVVMLEAHADEIGFIIKHITEDGFLRLDRVGGIDHATARGRRLTILGEKGPVPGIIGNTAIHIRDRKGGEKAPEIHELYVDVGVSSAKEAAKLGLRIGLPAVYEEGPVELGKKRIVGRALDNRIGGFILSEVGKALHAQENPADATIILANCVHEEIGGLGSMMVAHRLHPDVCVVLDVTHATDTPGIKVEKHGKVTLGGGPAHTHGAANQRRVVQRLMDVADAASLPLQHEAASRFTGTDADKIYPIREGIPTALVSLPLRYMHSVVETADLGDIQQVTQLLHDFALSVQEKREFHPG